MAKNGYSYGGVYSEAWTKEHIWLGVLAALAEPVDQRSVPVQHPGLVQVVWDTEGLEQVEDGRAVGALAGTGGGAEVRV